MHVVLDVIALLALGAALGFFGGVLGIGGGLLAIPILGVAFGLDEQHAQGTAMLMVAPNVLSSVWRYYQRGDLDRRLALLLGASAVPLTIASAALAVRLPSHGLRVTFALFLFAIAGWIVWHAFRQRTLPAPRRAASPYWALPIGAAGGAISGLFSVGGAVFSVPLLGMIYGVGQATAQGLGLALVAPGTIVAIATYGIAHDVAWSIGAPLALGGAFFVRYGVDVAHRLPDRVLRLLFASVAVLSGAALLVRS